VALVLEIGDAADLGDWGPILLKRPVPPEINRFLRCAR